VARSSPLGDPFAATTICEPTRIDPTKSAKTNEKRVSAKATSAASAVTPATASV
jgi:hypothetical protein